MKVKFEDGLAEVSVEGVTEPVRRGETVEVSDGVGKQLLQQGWVEVGSQKKAPAPVAAPTPVEKEKE